MKNLSDYKRLQTFKVLYEQLNFTNTAQLLYISQSTVSLHIKAIEDELGIILFDRRGKAHIEATEEGHVFYRYVTDVLHQWDEVSEHMKDLRKASNSCTIAVSHTFSQCYLEGLIDRLWTDFPEVHFEFMIQNSQWIHDALLREDIHLGIIEKPLSSKFMKRYELMGDPLVVAGSDNSVWLIREHDSGIRHFTDLYLAKENIVPTRIMKIHSNALICSLLDQGKGRSIVSRYAIADSTPFQELGSSFERKFYLIQALNGSDCIQTLSSYIRSYADTIDDKLKKDESL